MAKAISRPTITNTKRITGLLIARSGLDDCTYQETAAILEDGSPLRPLRPCAKPGRSSAAASLDSTTRNRPGAAFPATSRSPSTTLKPTDMWPK